jgi:hypothetical protein
VTPNAPSEPVWTLTGSDQAESAAARSHKPVGEMYYRREETLEVEAAESKPMRPDESAGANPPGTGASHAPAEAAASEQQQRRGWWQRTFRKD